MEILIFIAVIILGALTAYFLFRRVHIKQKHDSFTKNENNQITKVVLSKKNFVVIKNVRGESSISYVLTIAKRKKRKAPLSALVADARQKMIEQAELEGKARTIINEKIEEVIFEDKKTVIVSAQVIEFIE